jgi:ribose-phosphate pyrophosphokinase
MVDDISETAGTLTSAAKLLREHGAERIFAGVSHAVLNEQGQKRINESEIEELVSTNSTPHALGDKVKVVSIAGLLGEGIRRIHDGESVTSLFDI